MAKFFIIDDPRRSFPIRAMLKEAMTRYAKPNHAARYVKPKKELDSKWFQKFETLSKVASRYGVTEKELFEFCFVNGIYTLNNKVYVKTLDELMERAGFDPDNMTEETRAAQTEMIKNKINVR